MILVAGGNGRLGREVVTLLGDAGSLVRSGGRRPALADGRNVAPVSLDLRHDRSVRAAVGQAEVVIAAIHGLMSPSRHGTRLIDVDGHKRLIDAAVAAGVRKFVYTSAYGASPDHPLPFWRAKAEVERHLIASGLDFTVIRPGAFMELYAHDLIGAAVLAGRTVNVIGSGAARRNLVSVRDVAAVAVRAAFDPGLSRRIIDLAGPDNLSDREVAALYADLAGKPARVRAIPAPVIRALAVLLAPFHAGIARMMRLAVHMAEGRETDGDTAALTELLGRPPLTLDALARSRLDCAGQA